MIKGIGHLAFVVSDMEKALDFYCNGLGFKRAFELKDNKGNPWIQYIKIRDGQFIELFYGSGNMNETKPGAACYSHLCLEVDDIQQIANEMRAKKIPLDVEPQQGKDGNYQCWVKDPDGNRIEFMQMDPNSLQSKS